MNKLGDYINPASRRRGSANDYSRHSDLTEESLGEHNKLHGVLPQKAHIINYITSVDERNNKCSPYYKGLTDFTLSLNREKNTSGADSPGRESHTTSVFTSSSSSISTLFVKVQEFGTSCFTGRRMGKRDPSPAAAVTKLSSSFTKAATPVEMKSEEKGAASDPPGEAQFVDHKEKPLRERVSEPSAPAPPIPTILPATKTFVRNEKKTDGADVYKVNQKYIMADKYRPVALKDFLCNRSEAIRLQALVSFIFFT